MKKRIYIMLVLALMIVLPSHAVLKEKNIENTLSLLRLELTNYRTELERQSGLMKAQQEQVMMNMISVMNRSRQNSLMLYSQKNGFIFDLTYACHEATEQYQEFQKNVKPFRQYLNTADVEISRYDSLINELGTMGKYGLSEKAKVDRNVCITLAINIRHTLNDNRVQMRDYIKIYNQTEERLKYLNTYANTRYKDIQQSIFSNRGDNYVNILKNIGHNVVETSETVSEKYKPQKKVKSDWDSRIMLGLLIILAIGTGISLLINFVVIRWIARRLTRYSRFEKYKDWLEEKITCINLAMSVATFAIILGVVRIIVEQNFIIMASGLLINYTWLMEVILLSIMLRLDGDKIKSGFKLYSPIMVIGFLVIAFRIALVPNALVSLVFPPILAVSIFWQWNAIRKHQQNTEMSDRYYSYASLAVFIFSTISSWVGYTLLAVEILIWWVMQLTCILTITFMQGWLKTYSKNKKMDEKPITQTWIFNFIYKVIMPVLGVLSVMISIYWAADVFNLSDTTWKIFSNYYINEDGFRASIITIALAAILYFLFAYLNKTIMALLYIHFENTDHKTAATRFVMAKNVIQVVVWGIWLLIVLGLFKVNNTWLVVVSGGLSTGIGFAMKDIIENIYYGISLMTGRIKVGDLIECDGIRGSVSSINYTSTMVNTTDGSVIAFQNSQLFTKNYKNLTRNHGYELDVIVIGVAYGSNAAQVKALLTETVSKLDCRDKKKDVNVVFSNFGADSIDFKVLVWVPVMTRTYADGEIKEAIYNCLNENNIEIPFPQRDIHIIN
ncbi:MAG: mechanosensitive ion channel [Prevotella sp.]|nr:mechanosensitive ion channel [Prevotella sp.]MDD7709345.1 mechanosensitive ion channel [Prevotella sp.]MDY4151057.1 mechanosensitive ion channel [Prevotella sp.]